MNMEDMNMEDMDMDVELQSRKSRRADVSVFRSLKESFLLYRNNFWPLLLIAMIGMGPYIVLNVVVVDSISNVEPEIATDHVVNASLKSIGTSVPALPSTSIPSPIVTNENGTANVVSANAFLAQYMRSIGYKLLLVLGYCIFIMPLLVGTMIQYIAAIRVGKKCTAWNAFKRSARKFIWIILASLMSMLLASIGFIFLFFPGLYIYLGLMFVAEVIMIEDKRPCDAMKMCWDLMRSYRCQGFLLTIMEFFIPFIIMVVVVLPLSLVHCPMWASVFISELATAVLAPVMIGMEIIFYLELRGGSIEDDMENLVENVA